VSRYRFVAAEKAHHSVILLCRVLGVANEYVLRVAAPAGFSPMPEPVGSRHVDSLSGARATSCSGVHDYASNSSSRLRPKAILVLSRK
jgi:hypothetical protein